MEDYTKLNIHINKVKKEIIKTSVSGIFNKIDYRLIWILHNHPKEFSISQLSKLLKIAPVNTWKHLIKLEKMNIVKNPKVEKGEKKFIELHDNEEVKSIIGFLETFGKAVLDY